MKLVIGVIVLAATGTAAADGPRVIDRPCRVSSTEVIDHSPAAQRGKLRYALQPGARAHGRIVLDETTWGRRFPRITLDVASEVTGVEAGGRFQFREVVTGVTLDPSGSSDDFDVSAMRGAYEDAIGLAGETTFDAQGNCTVRHLTLARPTLDPRVLETVGELLGKLTWLPDEGVSVGARWRTTTTQIDDDGRTVAHTYTTELRAQHGNRIELEQTSSSSGGAQPEHDGLEVTSATAASTYRIAIELDRLGWAWSFKNTAHYKAIRNGVPQEVDMVRSSRGTATPAISR